MTAEGHTHGGNSGIKGLLLGSLGSIGVVYGDIGTSPLYAFKEALRPVADDGIGRGEVIGIVSCMLWTLTIIVTVKYVLFLMRADNEGEGGTLSLLALLMKSARGSLVPLIFMGIAGAALFMGDAMITPALSVLSAIEGTEFIEPGMADYVLPVSLGILIALFLVQRRGTGSVSAFFGPLTLLWFIMLTAVGLYHVSDDWDIFLAFNPVHAIGFLLGEGWRGMVVLGAVFLTVTGAEALYADLGHFGRKPIQLAWFAVVFPALAINYLGQGAFVLKNPAAASNPFFLMFPDWALLPAVIMATIATIIASQAVITGAFSLASQAIHMGFLPRMEVQHTSERHTGQIYLPAINAILAIGVIVLVLTFRSSDALATAYGISVTGAMVITTLLAGAYLRAKMRWNIGLVTLILLPLLALEIVFLGANLVKIIDGGYVPVIVAGAFTLVMWSWWRGSQLLMVKAQRGALLLEEFIPMISRDGEHAPVRVPGTAIFLTSDPEYTPPALMHNLKHNHVLHQQNIILVVRTARRPYVGENERYRISPIAESFEKLEITFGFMETPNVLQALSKIRKEAMKFEIMSTSFYLGRRQLVPSRNEGMPFWQDRIFIALANLATRPSDYFRLPSNRVVELGTQVVI
ncbi:potassium transporter Kup [Rhizobium sp. L1K21]|uniref:potassium transporter Kup n=1 Tax=Rhizobium sp. L1K21 TaxID=2954933 RepID=UPI002092AF92|nr:potassium transporter Kup [Rhizobium sp. L1K21]MCO6186938.1 potassium transporter Kup [Rhizobium sp. L1K21]